MENTLKKFLMCSIAAVSVTCIASCSASGDEPVPADPLEECLYCGDRTEFCIWAPGAEEVALRLYCSASCPETYETVCMDGAEDGLWRAAVQGNLKGSFYSFQVKRGGRWLGETAGIAAKAVGVNGRRGAVIDWAETDPEGWEQDESPLVRPSDIIVYELHHRDFSVHPSSGISNRGLFLALTEEGTKSPEGLATGIDHLKELGITYVQLLPSTDFASIDETSLSEGRYNWGYEPLNYNAVEGSYSSDPFEPAVRIREFKQMVMALHKAGIRVILDVVYNHTTDASATGFERTVPGYFYRMDGDGKFSNGSGCGNETASERAMFRKLMTESLEWWMTEYHIDGFRFDLMAIHDRETMEIIGERLRAIDPDVLLYGEGWAACTPAYPAELLAFKSDIWKLNGIGAFSDDMRDALRGPLDCSDAGFMGGVEGNRAGVEFGIAGGIEHPQVSVRSWASSPLQHVSYASCHDDHCLRDRLEEAADVSEKERIRMVKLAQTAVYLSQGIPFIFNGEELYRHKSGIKNSYNCPDSVNAIDWSYKSEYKELFDYYCALAAIRHAHPGFCLGDASLVRSRLEFLDTGSSLVCGFVIRDLEGIDSAGSLVVVLNASDKTVRAEIPEGEYVVLAADGVADVDGLGAFSGNFCSVKPVSATVLAGR